MAYFRWRYARIFSDRLAAIISGLHVAAFTSAWTSQFIRHRCRFVASCSSSTLNISLYRAASSLFSSAPTLLINSLSMALFNPLNSFRLVYLISGCSSWNVASLVSLLEGRRSPCVPTISIVACPSPTVNTPPLFCLTSPWYHMSIFPSACLVFFLPIVLAYEKKKKKRLRGHLTCFVCCVLMYCLCGAINE